MEDFLCSASPTFLAKSLSTAAKLELVDVDDVLEVNDAEDTNVGGIPEIEIKN